MYIIIEARITIQNIHRPKYYHIYMKKNAERRENGGEISHCSKRVFATAVLEISNLTQAYRKSITIYKNALPYSSRTNTKFLAMDKLSIKICPFYKGNKEK